MTSIPKKRTDTCWEEAHYSSNMFSNTPSNIPEDKNSTQLPLLKNMMLLEAGPFDPLKIDQLEGGPAQ